MDYVKALSKTAYELFKILKEKELTIGLAESCTAGLVASTIVENPGSSIVLKGSLVVYSPELKIKYLGVSPDMIRLYGAESVVCAQEMLRGLKLTMNSDISAIVTGVTGDTPTKFQPAGRVFFGISILGADYFFTKDFKGTRQEQRLQAAEFSLRMIKEKLE